MTINCLNKFLNEAWVERITSVYKANNPYKGLTPAEARVKLRAEALRKFNNSQAA